MSPTAAVYRPVKTALCLLSSLLQLSPAHFRWKEPPYEFVHDRLPIDILFGSSRVREQLEKGTPPAVSKPAGFGSREFQEDSREVFVVWVSEIE